MNDAFPTIGTPEADVAVAELLLEETRGRFVDPRQGYTAFLSYLDALGKGRSAGVPTGIPALDEIVLFRPGSLNIICGDPSNGKTSLALTLALSQARRGTSVLFASLEVPFEELETKICSNLTGLTFEQVEKSNVGNSPHRRTVIEAATLRAGWPLAVLDAAHLSVEGLGDAIRAYAEGHRAEIVYLDYLQLMSGDGSSREREVAKLSRGLKALAMELSIPIVAMSQLRRIDPRAEDHRPTLDRLRDSGQTGQDASVVIGTYWPHRYDPSEAEWGAAEVSILKNRNGPSKCLGVSVDWSSGRFFV